MAAELSDGALLSAFLDALLDKLLASEVKDFFKGKDAIVKQVKELKAKLSEAGPLLIDAEEKLIKDQEVKKWLDELKETIYDADDLVYKINTEALQIKQEGESQICFSSCNVLMQFNQPSTAFDKTIKLEIDEILGKLKSLLENKGPLEKPKLPVTTEKPKLPQEATGKPKLPDASDKPKPPGAPEKPKLLKEVIKKPTLRGAIKQKLAGAIERPKLLPDASAKHKLPGATEEPKLLDASAKHKLPGATEEPKLLDASDKQKLPGATEKQKMLPDTTEKEKLPDATNKQKQPEALPEVEESDVFGRELDKKAIIDKLLLSGSDSGNKFCVIPIVGMGGLGKTTLVQFVYNDERVNKRFDTKVWVTVGDADKIDCSRVMKTIILKVNNSEKCEIEEQLELLDKLKKALIGKKFLIVLDDVWDKDLHSWDVLKSSFESGSQGSRIIVTTRSTDVASIMKTGSIHHLHRISDEDGWQLFLKHVQFDANSNEYSILQELGRELVGKCNGLPLGIKLLCGLLHGKQNKKEWVNLRDSDTWELYERRSIHILPALWLSYYYLPSELKLCFAYFALFPKNYKFVKEKIILLWMAEGFLHSKNKKRIEEVEEEHFKNNKRMEEVGEEHSKNKKRMEEVGEEYWQELISRSLFQPSEDKLGFVMHDLMHDLAIFVSGEFCLWMGDSKFYNCVRKIRHLSFRPGVEDGKKFEVLSKAKGLRTFLSISLLNLGERGSLQKERSLETLLPTGSCLRVLSISRCDITKLPASIGCLKYVRYLDLSYTEIEVIPDTICDLYNLETLLLDGCFRLTRLPIFIENLINLRHLHAPPNLIEMPGKLGQLKNLKTLSEFVVSESLGSGINLLAKLPGLQGTLRISRLEKVADVKEVSEAELKGKEFLSKLILEWGSSHVPDASKKEIEVLGALKPHANLKEIDIRNYLDTSFPKWVGDHSFSHVVTVRLFDCKNCSSLPTLGQLPSLKHLVIRGFNALKSISSEFYFSSSDSPAVVSTKPFSSLELLRFWNMSELREWSFIEGGIFPRLEELELRDCPKLKLSLPSSLLSLKKLLIADCDQLLPLLPRGEQIDAAFPSLETISISRCDGQDSLLKGGLPSSLKKISILHCWKLTALDKGTFQRLTSLKKLEISFCDNLKRLPGVLPSSLSYLSIESCSLLTPRLQREIGEDWPVIAHIPTIDIRSHPLFDEEDDI